jgi:CRP-like cAMP-binding protein
MIPIMFDDLIDRLVAKADKRVRAEPGEQLFCAGDRVAAVFVVLEGGVRLIRIQADGEALGLQRAGAGDLLAEASMFAERYHCDAYADGPTTLARVPRSRVESLMRDDAGWLRGMAARLAHEMQRTRLRAEMLSLKRVDRRVEAWLTFNGTLPERGGWARLAEELAVSPEALYRELAKRRAAASQQRG